MVLNRLFEPRAWLGWVVGLWVVAAITGCIHRSPFTRLDTPTPISLVVLLDKRDGAQVDAEPPEVREAISKELARRNLDPEAVAPDVAATLVAAHSTQSRVELLARALGPNRLFLLIELKAGYFGQFEGGYKWNVVGQYTVGSSDRPAEATATKQDTAAFLTQDFEREQEALQSAAPAIGERLGALLDDHFAGRAGVAPAPRSGESTLDDWRSRPIYFVLLDRFAPSEARPTAQVDRNDPDFWHGGDLATLIHHLDDLQKLGVGTVWISPVSRCREHKKGPFGPSHCYWVEDLAAFEPRFGDFEGLRALRDALHARGMRLVLDVVLNHVANESPLLSEHPDWFHAPRALIDFSDPVQLEQGQLGGMPDLAQERPEVARYLIDVTRQWVSRIQPDGLRLDAVKHVPAAFWAQFSGAMHSEFPGLRLIGEDLEFDPVHLSSVARAGGFDSLFDFPLQGAVLGAFCRDGAVGAIGTRLSLDRLSAGVEWVTLLDNHDLARLATACEGKTDAAGAALALLFGLRGIPSLTYGVEAGLTGAADPQNRGDLEFPVRSTYRSLITELAALRAQHPALAVGESLVVAADAQDLSVLRSAPQQIAWLSLSRQGAPAMPPALGGIWRSLWHGSGGGVHVDIEVAATTPASDRFVARLVRGMATQRSIRFAAAEAPGLGIGDALEVVGAAPELGAWDPHKAISLAGTVALPANGAYELKLIVRRADGSVVWQPGQNAIVYVAAGEAPQLVSLAWGAPAPVSG